MHHGLQPQVFRLQPLVSRLQPHAGQLCPGCSPGVQAAAPCSPLQPPVSRQQPPCVQVHDALLLVKDGYDAKCEERRRRKQQAEETECTFKPATNERVNERAKVVARVTQPMPPPKEERKTTLEKEVADHCTFKPATNDYRGSSVHRTHCAFSPETLAGLRAAPHKRELGYSYAPSEAVHDSSRRSSRAPSVRGETSPYEPPVPPVPPVPLMQSGLQSLESPAAQALLARTELAAESESESALLAEIGVDVALPAFRQTEDGPQKPLSAQQLEAQFYADLAAELRDVDF